MGKAGLLQINDPDEAVAKVNAFALRVEDFQIRVLQFSNTVNELENLGKNIEGVRDTVEKIVEIMERAKDNVGMIALTVNEWVDKVNEFQSEKFDI